MRFRVTRPLFVLHLLTAIPAYTISVALTPTGSLRHLLVHQIVVPALVLRVKGYLLAERRIVHSVRVLKLVRAAIRLLKVALLVARDVRVLLRFHRLHVNLRYAASAARGRGALTRRVKARWSMLRCALDTYPAAAAGRALLVATLRAAVCAGMLCAATTRLALSRACAATLSSLSPARCMTVRYAHQHPAAAAPRKQFARPLGLPPRDARLCASAAQFDGTVRDVRRFSVRCASAVLQAFVAEESAADLRASRLAELSSPGADLPNGGLQDAAAAARSESDDFEARLRQAFADADADGSGSISKREFYRSLEGLGLKPWNAESLGVWKHFDRDASGAIDFAEFRQLGLALVDLEKRTKTRPPQKGRPAAPRKGGTFARRSFNSEQAVHAAATSIQKLARQRSRERVKRLRERGIFS